MIIVCEFSIKLAFLWRNSVPNLISGKSLFLNEDASSSETISEANIAEESVEYNCRGAQSPVTEEQAAIAQEAESLLLPLADEVRQSIITD